MLRSDAAAQAYAIMHSLWKSFGQFIRVNIGQN